MLTAKEAREKINALETECGKQEKKTWIPKATEDILPINNKYVM